MNLKKDQLINELNFKAVRSSGSGGQHVNKVATKVELYFNVNASEALSETQKQKLLTYFENRINQSGELVLACGDTRSQSRNKGIVIDRFLNLIETALRPKKKRRPTTVPKIVKKKRLEAKRKHSQKKAERKRPNLD